MNCFLIFQQKMPDIQTHLLVEVGTQTAHYPFLNACVADQF